MNSLYDIIESCPTIKEELYKCGILAEGKDYSDITSKLFSMDTFLKAHNINSAQLSAKTLEMIRSAPQKKSSRPFLLALLPCGLRNAFKETFTLAFPEYAGDETDEVLIEGNLNYEKYIYKYIDSLSSVEELPDILITSDFNSLYHPYFLNNFLTEKYFDPITFPVHPFFKDSDYIHPNNLMGMLTANLLVMMVDSSKFDPGKSPRSWIDLFSPDLKQKVMLRGDNDFFCNAILLPLFKQYGPESINRLACNTYAGMHPSAMVKAINSGNTSGCSVFVMPYSFAIKIKNTEKFQIIWPEDGAIISPVQMLLKKGAYLKYKREIDFITGDIMGDALEQIGFPSANANVPKNYPANKLNWLGWHFNSQNDLLALKQTIQQSFFNNYKPHKS